MNVSSVSFTIARVVPANGKAARHKQGRDPAGSLRPRKRSVGRTGSVEISGATSSRSPAITQNIALRQADIEPSRAIGLESRQRLPDVPVTREDRERRLGQRKALGLGLPFLHLLAGDGDAAAARTLRVDHPLDGSRHAPHARRGHRHRSHGRRQRRRQRDSHHRQRQLSHSSGVGCPLGHAVGGAARDSPDGRRVLHHRRVGALGGRNASGRGDRAAHRRAASSTSSTIT